MRSVFKYSIQKDPNSETERRNCNLLNMRQLHDLQKNPSWYNCTVIVLIGSLVVNIFNLLHITHTYDWNTAHRPLWWGRCPPGGPPLSSCTLHFYTISHLPNLPPSLLCIALIMLHPVPWKPAFLVFQGFIPPNTANLSFESLLKAIPKYYQQINERFLLCSLCTLFVPSPKQWL